MKRKTIISAALAAALTSGITGGSFAYFQDMASVNNIFTSGNVQIDLIESQIHRMNPSSGPLHTEGVAKDGTAANTTAIANGTEAKEDGTYVSDDVIRADAAGYDAYLAENGIHMVPGSNVRKCPYVINTGENDAYIRERVLIPVRLFPLIDNGPSYWTSTALSEGEVTSKAVTFYRSNGSSMDGCPAEMITERDGIEYYVFDFTFTDPIAPGEMTFWNVWGNIAISADATKEEMSDVGDFHVLVEADAIQADGFATAQEAFAAFGE